MESVNSLSEEERQKIWTSNVFKKSAMRFYAGWVALRTVCSEYMQHIQVAQKQLYANIRMNPTAKEAYDALKPMAEEFKKKLKESRKAIEEKKMEAQNEIDSLSQQENEHASKEQ